MSAMVSRFTGHDLDEANGSRLRSCTSLPNILRYRGLGDSAASSLVLGRCHIGSTSRREANPQTPRDRPASAPACALLHAHRQGSCIRRPHDRARLGATGPQRLTNIRVRRRKSPPNLRIVTGNESNDGVGDITSSSFLPSRSQAYRIGGTESTDVVRATPSISIGELSAGFPWVRSPGRGVKALHGDSLLPSLSTRSEEQVARGCEDSRSAHYPRSRHSVDRLDSKSSTAMTVSKSPRNAKASRRQLILDLNERKRQSLYQYDNDEFHDTNERSGSSSKPSSPVSSKPSSPVSLRHPQFRTLRRKKHFDIGRGQSNQDEGTPEPIAISFTLSSSTAPKSPAPSIPKPSSNTHLRKSSDPTSIATASDSTTCTTPPSPLSPENFTLAQSSPPSTSPVDVYAAPGSSHSNVWYSNGPSWSPTDVKFGHPSRPFYTAIRKQGVSPPPSRPTSASGPTPSNPRSSPASRPKSSPPPPLGVPSLPNSATRHLSLSAIPQRHMGFVSAFSLDLQDSDEDSEDPMPLPPTPAPVPARFSFGQSLAGAAKRLSRKSYAKLVGHTSLPPPATFQTYHHTPSQSISSFSPLEVTGSGVVGGGGSPTRSGFRLSTSAKAPGCGFSMSGEAELRLALARADAELETGGSASDDGDHSYACSPLSYPTTPAVSRPASPALVAHSPVGPSSPSSPGGNADGASKKSFKARVKKLREGLKHMLLMNPHADLESTHTPPMNCGGPIAASTD